MADICVSDMIEDTLVQEKLVELHNRYSSYAW